jgi:phosphoesterase RecJ-like protein
MDSYEEIKEFLLNLPPLHPIIVRGHENADMDSTGAGYGLMSFLRKMNKNAVFLLEDHERKKICWFEDKFGKHEYVMENVDTDKKTFTFILLDSSSRMRAGAKYSDYFNAAESKIVIDHHEKDEFPESGVYSLLFEDCSSTCEIVYNLMKTFDETVLDKDVATLLYAGILSDTEGFTRWVGPDTFRALSDLSSCGIDIDWISRKSWLEKSMDEANTLRKLLDGIQSDGVFHYIILDTTLPEYADIRGTSDLKRYLPTLRNIKEIDILVIFIVSGGSVSCGIWSNSGIEVAAFAIQQGGGGHKYAAGFTNTKSVEALIKEFKSFLKNAGAAKPVSRRG